MSDIRTLDEGGFADGLVAIAIGLCGRGLGFPVPAPGECVQGGVAGSGIAVSGRAVFMVVVG